MGWHGCACSHAAERPRVPVGRLGVGGRGAVTTLWVPRLRFCTGGPSALAGASSWTPSGAVGGGYGTPSGGVRGGRLRPAWGLSEASFALLGAVWGRLGTAVGRLGAVWGAHWRFPMVSIDFLKFSLGFPRFWKPMMTSLCLGSGFGVLISYYVGRRGRRSQSLRRVWAVELNLSLSVDSSGAPLNVPTKARMRLGHPDSDACSSLGFRV